MKHLITGAVAVAWIFLALGGVDFALQLGAWGYSAHTIATVCAGAATLIGAGCAFFDR